LRRKGLLSGAGVNPDDHTVAKGESTTRSLEVANGQDVTVDLHGYLVRPPAPAIMEHATG
jgi:hypothetical protein